MYICVIIVFLFCRFEALFFIIIIIPFLFPFRQQYQIIYIYKMKFLQELISKNCEGVFFFFFWWLSPSLSGPPPPCSSLSLTKKGAQLMGNEGSMWEWSENRISAINAIWKRFGEKKKKKKLGDVLSTHKQFVLNFLKFF